MDEHSLDSHFTGFTDISDHIEQPHLLDGSHFLDEVDNNSVDLTTLIEQSLTPLSVGNIINTMNHNNSYIHQQYEQQISQQPPTLSPLNHVNMYQLLSGNMNIGGMPVIIVNLPQQAVVSPATPSAEMSHLNIQEQKQQIISQPPPQPIAGIHPNIRNIQEEEEPPFKKRRPSVVDENDMDLMTLSHQMDLLRRNSLPVLHSIHVPPRLTIQPSVSVDELLSPSKFIRNDDIDLLEDYESGGEVISLLNEDGEEDAAEQAEDSPPSHNTNPFNFGNFYTSAPPAKNEFSAPLQPLQIPTGKSEAIEVQTAPTPTTDQPKKNRRRKSTPGGETPNNTPGTPDGRKLVCLGKRPRKNKKTQPEDQFLMKFTMRRNK